MQYFILSNFVLFRNSAIYFEKVKAKCYRIFIIDDFGKNHDVLYIFKTLDQKSAFNIYHNNY